MIEDRSKKKDVKLKTKEQLFESRMPDFSFSTLLEPYKEAGIESSPFERNIGLIVDWLVNKKKFPVEIAGAAILCTFMELYHGKEFKGVKGKYGSAGARLDHYIAQLAGEFLTQQLKSKTFKVMAEMRVGWMKEYIKGELALHLWPRWKRVFKYFEWKKKKEELLKTLDGIGK